MSDSSAPQESGIVLSASGLTRSFRSGSSFLEVLRGVDLELKRGEVCALRGASGSGKSTLLHILGLLDQADQGQLQIDGQQVTTFGASRLAKLRSTHIGFVFQQFQLLPELSALENVLVPRRLIHGFSWWGQRKQERAKASELLASVGLADRSHHRPNQLSGGEQQRVAIARALIGAPCVLLADEPTGNLDRETGAEVLNLLFQLARERNTAILVATHNERVASCCDRLLLMRKGLLLAEEHPQPSAPAS